MTKPLAPRRRSRSRKSTRAQVRPPAAGRTCGDFGGRNADSTPCERAASWGVPPEKVLEAPGLCRDHRPDAAALMHRSKRAFLELYRGGLVTLDQAADKGAGVDRSTIYRWRQADPEFARQFEEARGEADDLVAIEAEESLAARVIRGEASGTEVIFFLKNRAPRRWKDRHELTGAEGTPLIAVETLQRILGEG